MKSGSIDNRFDGVENWYRQRLEQSHDVYGWAVQNSGEKPSALLMLDPNVNEEEIPQEIDGVRIVVVRGVPDLQSSSPV